MIVPTLTNRTSKLVIPVHKIGEVRRELKEKLGNLTVNSSDLNVQEMYDGMGKIIEEVMRKNGKCKDTESTDDKLTMETKNLIKEREALRMKKDLYIKQRIQLIELQKVVKRAIKKD